MTYLWGGGSLIHYQLLQNQYKNYYANYFNPLVVKAFEMAIHGKFKNETRWISHEEFDKLKNTDPYVAFCFSFGNDLKSYAYGKDIEPYEKALHYLVVFQDESLMKEIFSNIDFSFVHKIKDVNDRRLKTQSFVKTNSFAINTPIDISAKTTPLLQNIINWNRLNIPCDNCSLNVNNFEMTDKSYDEIEIKPNSVIYCDIPYKSTNKYEISKDFDYEKFYSWCERQTELCFISEYSMPKDRFTCIAEIEHRSIICANENQSVIERVFLPNHQAKDYTIPSLFDMM